MFAPVDISNQSTFNRGRLGQVNGFIFHHTGGRGTPQSVVQTLNQRHLGVQYVMDRDGTIYRTLPQGAQGAHIMNSPDGRFSNANTMGMEVIANNDKDVTPQQVDSAKTFAQGLVQQYPGISIYGHGEVNPGHKEADEGGTITNAVRATPNLQIANAGMVNPAVTATPTVASRLASTATPFTLPAGAPAGMGNNNPLNMKYREGAPYAGVVGPSKNLDQGDPQFVFESPQAGWNAAYQLLNRKYTGGMLTPNQMIAGQGGWTPGNFAAAGNVARTMGIDPNADIRFSDPAQAKAFMKALVIQEQGAAGKAYPDAMLEAAVSGKLPIGGAVATTTPPAGGAVTPAAQAPATRTPAANAPATRTPLTPAQDFGSSLGSMLASLGTSQGGGGGSSAPAEVPDQPAIRAPALSEATPGPSPIPQAFQGGVGAGGSPLGTQLGQLAMQAPNAISDPESMMLMQNAPSITQGDRKSVV